jgi:ABC-type transport system involved in multi-copper enzyme maturation permease subunit
MNLALFFALLATYAALVTSVGLAIAVWVSRQGLAAGLGVGLYVLACFGWPFLSAMTSRGEDSPGVVLMLGSPFVGAVLGVLAVAEGTPEILFTRSLPEALAFGSLIQGLAALAIYAIACGSFDRKMGRSPDHSGGSALIALIPRFGRWR